MGSEVLAGRSQIGVVLLHVPGDGHQHQGGQDEQQQGDQDSCADQEPPDDGGNVGMTTTRRHSFARPVIWVTVRRIRTREVRS